MNCLIAKEMEAQEEYVDDELMEDIAHARKECEEGRTHRMLEGEALEEFLKRIGMYSIEYTTKSEEA